MANRTCSKCHIALDPGIAHCLSPTCTWCKACVTRKAQDSKR